MKTVLWLVLGSLAFLLMLPWGFIWDGFKELRDTWNGKSKNISRKDI